MQYLAYFMIYGVLGIFAGFVFYSLLYAVVKLIVGILTGAEFVSFVFLVFYIKKENGKITFKTANPQYNSVCNMKYKDMELKTEFVYSLIFAAVSTVITVILAVFTIKSGLPAFIKSMTIWMLILSAVCLAYSVYLMANINDPAMQSMAKTKKAQQKLLEGARPRELSFDEPEPEVKNYKQAELIYFLIRYWHHLDKGEYDKLAPYIKIFDLNMPPVYSHAYTGFLYEMIFYYSYIAQDSVAAQNLVSNMNGVLEADKDTNGRRVYAYFLYYTNKGRERAYQTANDGLASVEAFRKLSGGAADMEKDLLENLLNTKENN